MGVNFNRKAKKVYQVLQGNFGIGKGVALYLCSKVGLNGNSNSEFLTKDMMKVLTKLIAQELTIGVELKRQIRSNLRVKMKLRTYEGIRYAQGLPVHGQNTKTNARTARRLNKIK